VLERGDGLGKGDADLVTIGDFDGLGEAETADQRRARRARSP